MSALSDYIGDAPIGSVIQAPYNLTDANYLPCLGQKVVRASYPALSACLPSVGTFTATTRTRNSVESQKAACATATHFVINADGATSTAIQTSTDAVTWTLRTTPTTNNVFSLLTDGTNVVAAVAGAAGAWYSTDSAATWTASTGAVAPLATSQQTVMSFAPSLGTVGRFGFVSGTNFYYSDNRGVSFTAVATGAVLYHVTYTGTQWIGIGGTNVYASANGTSGWAQVSTPKGFGSADASALYAIVSDGAGKVLVTGLAGSVLTSLDGGSTWARRRFGSSMGGVISLIASPNYANGRFFVYCTDVAYYGVMCSADLQAWVPFTEPGAAVGTSGAIAYKAGVYVEVSGNSTVGTSWVEDTSKMYLPLPNQGGLSVGITSDAWNNNQTWIKAK